MTGPVKIREFRPEDLILIESQDEQDYLHTAFNTPHGIYEYGTGLLARAVLLSDGGQCAWTALHDDGRVLGTGGVVYFTSHSGEAWLHLSKDFPKYARHIIPKIKEQVDAIYLPRIQALTDVGFDRAERFIKYLGFQYEATLEKYGPDQVDQKMWKIIKETKYG